MDQQRYSLPVVAIDFDGQRVLINASEFDESQHVAWLEVEQQEEEQEDQEAQDESTPAAPAAKRGRPAKK